MSPARLRRVFHRSAFALASAALAGGCAHPGFWHDRAGEHEHRHLHGGGQPMAAHGGPGMQMHEHGMMQPGMGPMMMNPLMNPLGRYDRLDLTEAQLGEMRKIGDALRREHWDLMGKLREERIAAGRLERAAPRDVAAIGQTYDRMGALRRQLATSTAEARNRIDALLTPEQRAQLNATRPPKPMPGMPGQGMQGPGMQGPGMQGPGPQRMMPFRGPGEAPR